MKFVNKYEYSDLLELFQARQRVNIFRSFLFGLVGLSFLMFPVLFYKELSTGPATTLDRISFILPLMFLGAAFFPPTNAFAMAWLTHRQQKKVQPTGFDCEITDQSLDLYTHTGAHYLKWPTFIKGRESKTAICLFTATEGFIFPKRYFDSESLIEFKKLINSNTKIRL